MNRRSVTPPSVSARSRPQRRVGCLGPPCFLHADGTHLPSSASAQSSSGWPRGRPAAEAGRRVGDPVLTCCSGPLKIHNSDGPFTCGVVGLVYFSSGAGRGGDEYIEALKSKRDCLKEADQLRVFFNLFLGCYSVRVSLFF